MKGLYVAYNKAIQTEAEKSFPRNVECRTAHSLAYCTAQEVNIRRRYQMPVTPRPPPLGILTPSYPPFQKRRDTLGLLPLIRPWGRAVWMKVRDPADTDR